MGNLYWAQPLLGQIAASLGVDPGSAGLLVTVTQIGYAVGVFFVVPLGDVMERRRLIPFFLAFSAVALVVSAIVPTYSLLLVGLALVSATSVSGQMLSPLAGDSLTLRLGDVWSARSRPDSSSASSSPVPSAVSSLTCSDGGRCT